MTSTHVPEYIDNFLSSALNVFATDICSELRKVLLQSFRRIYESLSLKQIHQILSRPNTVRGGSTNVPKLLRFPGAQPLSERTDSLSNISSFSRFDQLGEILMETFYHDDALLSIEMIEFLQDILIKEAFSDRENHMYVYHRTKYSNLLVMVVRSSANVISVALSDRVTAPSLQRTDSVSQLSHKSTTIEPSKLLENVTSFLSYFIAMISTFDMEPFSKTLRTARTASSGIDWMARIASQPHLERMGSTLLSMSTHSNNFDSTELMMHLISLLNSSISNFKILLLRTFTSNYSILAQISAGRVLGFFANLDMDWFRFLYWYFSVCYIGAGYTIDEDLRQKSMNVLKSLMRNPEMAFYNLDSNFKPNAVIDMEQYRHWEEPKDLDIIYTLDFKINPDEMEFFFEEYDGEEVQEEEVRSLTAKDLLKTKNSVESLMNGLLEDAETAVIM
ncbi:hypothetical protein PCE1_002381 [Barthelona sp. PCE]